MKYLKEKVREMKETIPVLKRLLGFLWEADKRLQLLPHNSSLRG